MVTRATRTGAGELLADVALIDASDGVWPEVLTVDATADLNRQWYPKALAHAALAAASRAMPPNADHVTTHMNGTTATRTARDGKVTTKVTTTLIAEGGRDHSNGGNLHVGGVGAALAAAPETLKGRAFEGLGRLTSVTTERLPDTKATFNEVRHRFTATFAAEAA